MIWLLLILFSGCGFKGVSTREAVIIDQRPPIVADYNLGLVYVTTNIWHVDIVNRLKWQYRTTVLLSQFELEQARHYQIALPERNRIADLIEYGQPVPDVQPIPFEHDNTYEHQNICLNCRRVAKLTGLTLPFNRDSLIIRKLKARRN